MATKSNAVAVEAEVVETVVAEQTVTEPVVAQEPIVTVAQPTGPVEVPVPADFKGKEVSVDLIAGEISMAVKFFGGLTAAIEKVIDLHPGEAMLVATPKDGPKQRVLLVAENKVFIEAALASRPALRPMFKDAVLALVAAGRATPEYLEALAALKLAEENLFNVRSLLWDLTESYAEPFDASQFVARHEYAETKPASDTQAQHAATTAGAGRAARTSSKHQWNLDKYIFPRLVEGVGYEMHRGQFELNGRTWGYSITNELGEIVAVGTSPADVDKAWLSSRGLSTAVNTAGASRWDAAAQEAAFAEGREYTRR